MVSRMELLHQRSYLFKVEKLTNNYNQRWCTEEDADGIFQSE